MSAPYLTYRNVAFYPKEEFGIKEVNFDLYKRKKYHFILANEDKLNALLGVMEGRFQKDFGSIRTQSSLTGQSDRQLLGDKVYKKLVNKRLALDDPFTFFDGKRCSKHGFIDKLKAKSLLEWPIYRLKGEDKIKFTLLSLLFQETGIILISRLFEKELSQACYEHFKLVLEKTGCVLCLFSTHDPQRKELVTSLYIPNLEEIDLTDC